LRWFLQSQVTPLSVVDSLHFIPKFTIGHFTQMIYDKNNRVGCAMTQWPLNEYGDGAGYQVTCNYYRAPLGNWPLYERGEVCSSCNVCDEEDFYGLCVE
jgi:hypothetical protein